MHGEPELDDSPIQPIDDMDVIWGEDANLGYGESRSRDDVAHVRSRLLSPSHSSSVTIAAESSPMKWFQQDITNSPGGYMSDGKYDDKSNLDDSVAAAGLLNGTSTSETVHHCVPCLAGRYRSVLRV